MRRRVVEHGPRPTGGTASERLDMAMDDHSPAEITVADTQVMFNRVLANWASDLLRLRREGLAAPGWRVQVETEDGIAWRRAA